MRNPSDVPAGEPKAPGTPGRRMGDRGRLILIIGAVVLVGLILLTRVFSSFYVDYLWHQSVGRTDVFWGVWWAKLTMFLLFGGVFVAVAILNLVIADRLAPSTFSANTHPAVERFHEFFGHRMRLLRIGVAVVIGLLFALPAMGHWQDWLMFRNSKSFGINDPEFGNDIGFYLFRLPFISFLLDWLFAAVVFITALVIGTHVLNGGIVLQPPRPKVRKATKAHVAVLLAVLAVLKAGDYVVKRYELTYEASGVVRGPGYASVNAELPAIVLLALIAVLVAGLFLWTLKSGSWRIPIIASALWAVIALIGGVIYPAAVQAFSVNPNKKDREAEYVARNIDATRNALGIDKVDVQQVEIGASLTESTLSQDVAPLRDVRLFSPDKTMQERFRTDKGQTTGLTITDLDVDRYSVDGTVRQELIAARELNLSGVANKSWQGTHLLSTHGCGLVSAPAGVATTSGRPAYEEKQLDRPELYFSETLGGYAVVNTTVKEGPDCDTSSDGGHYNGIGGVKLDSTFKRLAFALEYLDYNLFASSAISDDSRLISVRSVSDRVREIAPFLSVDGDPYPVALDGRVLWIVDGYTTSDRYPYGENGDRSQLSPNTGLNKPFNYVRNSVKAVVDGYDGTVRMYVVDDTDPVLKVWRSAFPNLFLPKADLPPGLIDHLRYPEDIFRIQTAAYAKYRLAADAFFSRDGLWSVAQAAPTIPSEESTSTGGTGTDTSTTEATQQAPTDFAADSNSARVIPYYSIFHPPNNGPVQFALFRPFVLFAADDGRKEMQAYMTASSDPDTYGQLTVYDVSNAIKPDGPATITSTMNSDFALSQEITLLSRGGSQVEYGDLQMFSVGGSVLWVRPLYVVSTETKQPTFRRVVVFYNGQVSFGTSLRLALAPLFPGFDTDLGDVQGGDGGNGSGEPVDPGGPDKTPAQLLQEADDLFTEAEAVLKDKGAAGLGEYQTKVAQAQALVKQALDILDAQQSGSSDPGSTDPGTDDTTPDSTPATNP